mgnify:CR=1 FL=1
MTPELLGRTLQTIGEVMVAYTAIMVHFRFWKEHKIDKDVFAVMKKEQTFGVIGIVFLIIGYILELPIF